jgi:hypothetical protein
MKRPILALLSLAVLASLPAVASAQQLKNEFEYWKGFGEGSSVTSEASFESAKGKTTSKTTTTLKKKEADKITLAAEDEVNGKKMPPRERVLEKDKKPAECAACGKVHKEAVLKEGEKEKVKVGDKDVEALIVDVTSYGCNDKETQMRIWTTKEIPGFMAKMEIKNDKTTVIVAITAFEKK